MSTVVILGLARQGKALARYFAERGIDVTISDNRTAQQLAGAMVDLSDLSIEYVLGEHPIQMLDHCDMLCLSGGVPTTLPIVVEAMRRGIPVSNDAQEFLRRCPALVVGITGSAGKTTTTSLVGDMLKESGLKTWVGGNIGNPLLPDLDRIRAEDRVVMELSSFQLEIMNGPNAVSPEVAGVLNITPNHLDRHGTMQAYIAAKRNIVAHQKIGDIAVLGYDEPNACALSTATGARVRYFSGKTEVEKGAFLSDNALVLRNDSQEATVCHRSDIHLRGFHNVMNVLAAIVLADAAGAELSAMRRAIQDFRGVAHRLEEVRRWGGALWINDSIATAPERVLAALQSFHEPLVLLAGGRDKDLPWEVFAHRVVRRVRVLITFGEAAPLIQSHVERALQEIENLQHRSPEVKKREIVLEGIIPAETLETAVHAATQWVQPGDVVLLSPGGTSFDAYRDFEQRGEHFKQLVRQLNHEAAS